jgi:hypothetical protein
MIRAMPTSRKAKKKTAAKSKPKKKAAVTSKAKAKKKKAAAPAKKKKKAAVKSKAKKKAAHPKTRRDGTGHLDLAYERDLRRRSKENLERDDDRGFLVGKRKDDALANELAQEFVETVTSGEDEGVELRDQTVEEEEGGPFVGTTGEQEFADGPDASNPADATREPFPKTGRAK